MFLQVTDGKCQAIAKGIADGVQFMHTHNLIIVHQDLKPLNIMVSDYIYIPV